MRNSSSYLFTSFSSSSSFSSFDDESDDEKIVKLLGVNDIHNASMIQILIASDQSKKRGASVLRHKYICRDRWYIPSMGNIGLDNLFFRRSKKVTFFNDARVSKEGCRADIGVLQSRFAIVGGAICFWEPKMLGNIMKSCVILHNMIVKDERDEHLDLDYEISSTNSPFLNANASPDDALKDPHGNAMLRGEQPQYWTDFLAMEQERHNQRVQWEQQMANQFNALGNQFNAIATAQNSLIQQFGGFCVDTKRHHEVASNRIEQIEHRANEMYHHYLPSPPPDNDL
ncbi:unnamed protein product [Camellia sinensis]